MCAPLPLPVLRERVGVRAFWRDDPHPCPLPAYREREKESGPPTCDRPGAARVKARRRFVLTRTEGRFLSEREMRENAFDIAYGLGVGLASTDWLGRRRMTREGCAAVLSTSGY